MRRAMTTGLIGLALLLTAARPASAQWNIIKWLEELSGPGHFVLNGAEVHLGCQLKGQANAETQTAATQGPAILRGLFCDQNLTTPKGSTTQVWKEVRYFFAVLAAGGTGTNPLGYPAGEKKDKVSAWTITGGPVYRLSAATDLGASVGFVRFSGSTTRSFNKFVVDPYVVIRPLVLLDHKWEQLLGVRLDATWYPQGFTLEDFGAISGPLNGDGEVIFQIGLVVNLAYLGWK